MGLSDFATMFLGAGALLSIAGGLGVCGYNCKWFDEYGTYRLQWKGYNAIVANSVVSAGVIGVFYAVAAIAAIVVLFLGLGKMIVVIVFAIVAVLYLGVMVPEAILLDKTKYGGYGSIWVPYEKRTWHEDEDWIKWVVSWQTEQDKVGWDLRIANMKDEEKLVWTMAKQHLDEILTSGYSYSDPYGYFSFTVNRIEGYDTPVPMVYNENNRWVSWSLAGLSDITEYRHSCIIDYVSPDTDISPLAGLPVTAECEKITIETVDCVGGWTRRKLENAIIDKCIEIRERVLESVVKEGGDEHLWGKDEKAADAAKTEREKLLEDMYNTPALRIVDSVMLGVQTVGFVLVVVGIIFFFVGGTAQVSKE